MGRRVYQGKAKEARKEPNDRSGGTRRTGSRRFHLGGNLRLLELLMAERRV